MKKFKLICSILFYCDNSYIQNTVEPSNITESIRTLLGEETEQKECFYNIKKSMKEYYFLLDNNITPKDIFEKHLTEWQPYQNIILFLATDREGGQHFFDNVNSDLVMPNNIIATVFADLSEKIYSYCIFMELKISYDFIEFTAYARERLNNLKCSKTAFLPNLRDVMAYDLEDKENFQKLRFLYIPSIPGFFQEQLIGVFKTDLDRYPGYIKKTKGFLTKYKIDSVFILSLYKSLVLWEYYLKYQNTKSVKRKIYEKVEQLKNEKRTIESCLLKCKLITDFYMDNFFENLNFNIHHYINIL